MTRNVSDRSPVTIDPMIWLTVACLITVLSLHHVNYTKDYIWEITHRFFNPYSLGLNKILQQFAVGGFFLMSGFKLTKSKRTEPAWDFIRNRLLRIYPMYLLTIVLFSFTSYPYLRKTLPSVGNFVIHALCLQSIVPNMIQDNYNTIWFVSNLVCYYGLFLILRRWVSQAKTFGLVLGLMLGVISGLNFVPVLAGKSLMIQGFGGYLVYFSIGMLYAEYQSDFERLKTPIALIISAISSSALLYSATQFGGIFQSGNFALDSLQTALAIMAILPLHFTILKVCRSIAVPSYLATCFKQLSFASFGIFLLHRPVWSMMANIWGTKSYIQSGFILGLGIPVIFALSYALQSSYNKGLRWYLGRQSNRATAQ
ncbi:acyltransferase [filamentous cyanobacterium LEGE 11480]|uniref:Acyltransferase n=1 Tax=Romeriopsis navalis LEGE 11480 TaxID=2777977 RepID=A0A928VPZ7_9CYAN|nr:acyltransferase family protein [Romeriopsis navalis]MBE9029999.1 acyltransferase [Romeriopsis navalis LEGE 11480]